MPLLKTNGVLYIEVPDATAYVEFLYSPFQDFNTEHINHFRHQLYVPWSEDLGSAQCLKAETVSDLRLPVSILISTERFEPIATEQARMARTA